MSDAKPEETVEPLLPVRLGRGDVLFARGVRAGRWVFATGQLGQDFASGVPDRVLRPRSPHGGPPKREREADLLFDNLEEVLAAGGTSFEHLVRTDQYYTSVDMVPPFQAVRRRRLGPLIPPSTSIVERELLLPRAEMELHAMAVVPGAGIDVEHRDDAKLRGRPTSGYSAALTAGEFVFVPGITATAHGDEPRLRGKARAAMVAEGMQWGGQPIKLETEYIISERILPSLELAGAGPGDVVKAQAYLTDPRDYAAFNEVWVAHFGEHPPALSVIPCAERGLALESGELEVNVIALPGGEARRETIDAGVSTALRGQPQAVRAGDLLFLSALLASDEDGIVAEAEVDSRQPWFQCSAEAQAECILDNAARLCAAAGTSLGNVVRIQQFHTDLADFHPVYRAWARRLPDRPLPFSAMAVPGPLPVPGCTVMMDLWFHVP